MYTHTNLEVLVGAPQAGQHDPPELKTPREEAAAVAPRCRGGSSRRSPARDAATFFCALY